jgi:GNAT superfamily N-acetyltransferase
MMGKRVEVRPAGIADARRLAVLYAGAHAETYAPIFGAAYLPLDLAETEAVCLALLKGEGLVLLACCGGRDAGFLHLASGRLNLLYLLRAYHRQGIGRTLMGHALTAAAENGWREIIFIVLPANAAAIRFYESLGARRIGSMICQHVTGPFEDWVFRLVIA